VVPVRIAGGDAGAAGANQAADGALVDLSVEVEHEQVFLGGSGRGFAFPVVDELEMPGGPRPPGHQQRVSAFGRGVGPVQDVEAEAVDPEPLGRAQIAAGARDAQVAGGQRFHGPIIPGTGATVARAMDLSRDLRR
jgi:hypothetical protein